LQIIAQSSHELHASINNLSFHPPARHFLRPQERNFCCQFGFAANQVIKFSKYFNGISRQTALMRFCQLFAAAAVHAIAHFWTEIDLANLMITLQWQQSVGRRQTSVYY